MKDLFRAAAVDHADRRLEGEVFLAAPLPTRVIGVGLATLSLVTLVVALCTSFPRVEVVQGVITPEAGLLRIKAQSSGTIVAIRVSEGQSVRSGAPIALVRLSTVSDAGDSGTGLLKGLDAEDAANATLAALERQKLLDSRADLTSQRASLSLELAEARTRLGIVADLANVARRGVSRSEQLAKQGFQSQATLDVAQANVLAMAREQSTLRASILGLERQIEELDHHVAEIPASLATFEAQQRRAAAIASQKRSAADAAHLSLITAPVDGKVVGLPVSLGETISADRTVAIITPRGSDLVAELYVPSRAAGFIKPGDSVRLKYKAFPYQIFGASNGTITRVSKTVLSPQEFTNPGIDLKETAFRVKAKLDRQSVSAYGSDVLLQPGMSLTGEIIIERRSLARSILSPMFARTGR